MKWNVIFYDFMKHRFKYLNVFDHISFNKGVREVFERYKDRAFSYGKSLGLDFEDLEECKRYLFSKEN